MIKTQTISTIDFEDWNALVQNTYGKPYNLQQQGGCMDRQMYPIEVPCQPNDFNNTTLPEILNGNKKGVSFEAWLARDPKEKRALPDQDYAITMFWERNFYPDITMLINDLHKKGLLSAGNYYIDINW